MEYLENNNSYKFLLQGIFRKRMLHVTIKHDGKNTTTYKERGSKMAYFMDGPLQIFKIISPKTGIDQEVLKTFFKKCEILQFTTSSMNHDLLQ